MGNSLGSKKTIKIMKINGETFKLRAPIKAIEVLKDYSNHVLLESESVKYYGIRAKPIESHQFLEPKRLYFLMDEIPREKNIIPRRVRSGINMNARDRLEGLMLARRSNSDLSHMKPPITSSSSSIDGGGSGGVTRVKMRVPRAEIEKLVKESRDDEEVAEKIRELYYKKNNIIIGGSDRNDGGGKEKQVRWSDDCGGGDRDSVGGKEGFKEARQKRVSFLPINEGGSQIAVATC